WHGSIMLRNYRGLFSGAMEISGVQPHSSGIPVLWMGLISALHGTRMRESRQSTRVNFTKEHRHEYSARSK
ncbi:hypothetical protein, partial [Pseudomonas aeruginosa]|uniref:hypothetical protein n=2 Tax=Pseudomonas aeruginosa TaxID=287 RepID=UPI00196995A8